MGDKLNVVLKEVKIKGLTVTVPNSPKEVAQIADCTLWDEVSTDWSGSFLYRCITKSSNIESERQ